MNVFFSEQFQELYPKYPDVFTPHMDAIFDKSIGGGPWEESMIAMFFHSVSMNYIEVCSISMKNWVRLLTMVAKITVGQPL